MRNAFANELVNLARINEKIVLLSGDIGNCLFDEFKKNFPHRFYNCGVAEANMASVAAGLAMNGLQPITYTITPFNTIRCLEQIKIDICYHNLPVIIVGVGAGLSYASLGGTHHSLDDFAHLRSIPNIKIICPADPYEVKILLKESLNESGPIYFRIGKKGEPTLHSNPVSLKIGKAFKWTDGSDFCLLTIGNTLGLAHETISELKKNNIFGSLISFTSVKPLDIEMLKWCFKKFKMIVTIEEHSIHGGFYSSICEWVCLNFQKIPKIIPFAASDIFPKKIGNQAYLRKEFKLEVKSITHKIINYIKESLCEQQLQF
jgi:transketolase